MDNALEQAAKEYTARRAERKALPESDCWECRTQSRCYVHHEPCGPWTREADGSLRCWACGNTGTPANGSSDCRAK